MLVSAHCFVRKRGVLVGLMRGGCKGGAKVRSPEDPVAQKEGAHEKEREQPASRPAEQTRPYVLPATILHSARILPSIPVDEQPPKGPPAPLGLRLTSEAPLALMLKEGSPW